ncbi:hypothetical protein U1Q18_032363 [Sarracenia purpurea var. burkii]
MINIQYSWDFVEEGSRVIWVQRIRRTISGVKSQRIRILRGIIQRGRLNRTSEGILIRGGFGLIRERNLQHRKVFWVCLAFKFVHGGATVRSPVTPSEVSVEITEGGL